MCKNNSIKNFILHVFSIISTLGCTDISKNSNAKLVISEMYLSKSSDHDYPNSDRGIELSSSGYNVLSQSIDFIQKFFQMSAAVMPSLSCDFCHQHYCREVIVDISFDKIKNSKKYNNVCIKCIICSNVGNINGDDFVFIGNVNCIWNFSRYSLYKICENNSLKMTESFLKGDSITHQKFNDQRECFKLIEFRSKKMENFVDYFNSLSWPNDDFFYSKTDSTESVDSYVLRMHDLVSCSACYIGLLNIDNKISVDSDSGSLLKFDNEKSMGVFLYTASKIMSAESLDNYEIIRLFKDVICFSDLLTSISSEEEFLFKFLINHKFYLIVDNYKKILNNLAIRDKYDSFVSYNEIALASNFELSLKIIKSNATEFAQIQRECNKSGSLLNKNNDCNKLACSSKHLEYANDKSSQSFFNVSNYSLKSKGCLFICLYLIIFFPAIYQSLNFISHAYESL